METAYLDTEHYLVAQLVNTMQANEDRREIIQLPISLGAKFSKDGDKCCWMFG